MCDRIEESAPPENQSPWKRDMESFFRSSREPLEDVSPERLRQWLTILVRGHSPVNAVQRDIVRGITINHLQTALLLKEEARRNNRTERFVIFLAILSIVVAAIQTWYTVNPPRDRVNSVPTPTELPVDPSFPAARLKLESF